MPAFKPSTLGRVCMLSFGDPAVEVWRAWPCLAVCGPRPFFLFDSRDLLRWRCIVLILRPRFSFSSGSFPSKALRIDVMQLWALESHFAFLMIERLAIPFLSDRLIG